MQVVILCFLTSTFLSCTNNLFLLQCSYNVIGYKDKPRLGTALELLKTTQEIEQRLEEVCVIGLSFQFLLSTSSDICKLGSHDNF
jgi:hypothetical protein